MIKEKHRKKLAAFMRRLYKKGLSTSSGGNISYRDSNGYIYITASQTDKAKMKSRDIAVFDSNYNNLCPDLKPSMEIDLHLSIYKSRKDVSAIMHAHPVYVSVFSISNKEINSGITGEARYILGDISYVDYEIMGSKELAEKCKKAILQSDVAILRNHGALCVGKSLFEVFDKLEVLEFTAKIYYKSLAINSCIPLSPNQIADIDRLKN